jgi:hypothetical protein
LEWRSGPESDPDNAPAGETTFSVPLSSQGYFQVVGVQPGRHLLTVACSAATAFRKLMVQADGETQIDPPLQLEDEPSISLSRQMSTPTPVPGCSPSMQQARASDGSPRRLPPHPTDTEFGAAWRLARIASSSPPPTVRLSFKGTLTCAQAADRSRSASRR